LKITALRWQEFWAMHFSGMFLAFVSLLEVWGIASLLRDFSITPLALSIITVSTVLLTWATLTYLKPKFILGQDGTWAAETLVTYLSQVYGAFAGRHTQERSL
jgi:hypothetical protein